jgi:hypothetical protein
MSCLVNINHSHKINAVSEPSFVGSEDLTNFEDNTQLIIIKSVKVGLE